MGVGSVEAPYIRGLLGACAPCY